MRQEVSLSSALRVDVTLMPEIRDWMPHGTRTVFIVVDVIRATTTLSMLFERGCRRVLIAPDIPSARAARDRAAADPARGLPPLLAGEAGGLAPAGFDFGNSPAEIATREVTGRDVIFATTNGTRALRACVGGGAILAGALRNSRAVAAAALTASLGLSSTAPIAPTYTTCPSPIPEHASAAASEAAPTDEPAPDIVVVCAARGQRPAYDDTLCAGLLVRELSRQLAALGRSVGYGDGALIALALANESDIHHSLRELLARSGAGAATRRVGLEGDLEWCAALDVAEVVPRVIGTEENLLVMATI